MSGVSPACYKEVTRKLATCRPSRNEFFRYLVTIFELLLQLKLLGVFQLQLRLQLTDVSLSVIAEFQLQLILTAITLR